MARPAGLLGAFAPRPSGRPLVVPIRKRIGQTCDRFSSCYISGCLYRQTNKAGNMARPAGFEPATLGLAYHYSFHCCRIQSAFVVWTISSPFQVPHVWPLRNPTIISCQFNVLTLIILRRFYPHKDLAEPSKRLDHPYN